MNQWSPNVCLYWYICFFYFALLFIITSFIFIYLSIYLCTNIIPICERPQDKEWSLGVLTIISLGYTSLLLRSLHLLIFLQLHSLSSAFSASGELPIITNKGLLFPPSINSDLSDYRSCSAQFGVWRWSYVKKWLSACIYISMHKHKANNCLFRVSIMNTGRGEVSSSTNIKELQHKDQQFLITMYYILEISMARGLPNCSDPYSCT